MLCLSPGPCTMLFLLVLLVLPAPAISLLLDSFVNPFVDVLLGPSIQCYTCEKHHHDHHHPESCKRHWCRKDQFCRMNVDKTHNVKGECKSKNELNHCYHDLKHYCPDYTSSTFVGECVFCCTTLDCVRQALALDKAVTTPSPTPNTTVSRGCANECADISDECATVPHVCTGVKFGPLVCKKFCGLCNGGIGDHTTSTTTATTTTTTTTGIPTTTTVATSKGLALPTVIFSINNCIDKMNCAIVPGICKEGIAKDVCPKFCNLCTAPVTSAPTTVKPTPTIPTTTPIPTAKHSQRSCYQCGDYDLNLPCTLAELTLNSPTHCATGAYCMTDVYNTPDKRQQVIKRCVGQRECQRKWYDETSDRSACTSYNSLNRVPDLSCHFCCKGDECNKGIVPEFSSLYS